MSKSHALSVLMIVENQPYPRDVRVRNEAEALAHVGYTVEVLAPRAEGEKRTEAIAGVRVHRYRIPKPVTPLAGSSGSTSSHTLRSTCLP